MNFKHVKSDQKLGRNLWMVELGDETFNVTLALNDSLKQWYSHQYLTLCPHGLGGGGCDHGDGDTFPEEPAET